MTEQLVPKFICRQSRKVERVRTVLDVGLCPRVKRPECIKNTEATLPESKFRRGGEIIYVYTKTKIDPINKSNGTSNI